MTSSWARLTSRQIESRTDGLLVLPIGATEQHGPHLPVHLDSAVADHLAHAAASDDVLDDRVTIAPVLSFGASAHHLPRGGTLSLSSRTLARCLDDLMASAATAGWRRILVVNGHGGNRDIARQAARDCATTYPVIATAVSYWDLAPERVREAATRHGVVLVPGHAGAFETSLAMAMVPVFADVGEPPDRQTTTPGGASMPPDVILERHGWIHRVDGYTDNPATATTALGTEVLDILVRALTDAMHTLLEAPL